MAGNFKACPAWKQMHHLYQATNIHQLTRLASPKEELWGKEQLHFAWEIQNWTKRELSVPVCVLSTTEQTRQLLVYWNERSWHSLENARQL